MSKGAIFESDLLKLIFNAVAIAGIADNAAAPLTALYLSLHTADPGNAGNQNTSETAYIGYARVAVNRTSGGWVVTGSSVSPAANIDFGSCTASPGGAVTHAAIGTDASGAGKILYSGALTPSITMATGFAPRIPPSSTITEN